MAIGCGFIFWPEGSLWKCGFYLLNQVFPALQAESQQRRFWRLLSYRGLVSSFTRNSSRPGFTRFFLCQLRSFSFSMLNFFNDFWDPTPLQSLQNTRNSKREEYILSPEFGGRLTQLLTEHQAAPHWSFLTSRNCSWLWYCLLPISKVHFWILGWDFSKNSQKVHNHIKTTPDDQFNWDRVRVWVRGHNTDSDMDLLATPPRMPMQNIQLSEFFFPGWLKNKVRQW